MLAYNKEKRFKESQQQIEKLKQVKKPYQPNDPKEEPILKYIDETIKKYEGLDPSTYLSAPMIL